MSESALMYMPILFLFAAAGFACLVDTIYHHFHKKNLRDEDAAFYKAGGNKESGPYIIYGCPPLVLKYLKVFFVIYLTILTLLRLYRSYSLILYIEAFIISSIIYLFMESECSPDLIVDGEKISYPLAFMYGTATFYDIEKIQLDRQGLVLVIFNSGSVIPLVQYSPRFIDDIKRHNIPIEHYIIIFIGPTIRQPGGRDPDYKE